MSLADQQRVVSRLLANEPFRRRFFAAAPDGHAEFGLAVEDFVAVRRLAEDAIAILNRAFLLKRFDYLRPAFPWTLDILAGHVDRFEEAYAGDVPMPGDPAEEVEAFAAWARARSVPAAWAPLLAAVVDTERIARRLPLAPKGRPFRLRGETRPAPSGVHAIHTAGVDLPVALAERVRTGSWPVPAPPGPVRLLVWNESGRLQYEPHDEEREQVLRLCDGRRTLRDIETPAGGAATDHVRRWLTDGILIDRAA